MHQPLDIVILEVLLGKNQCLKLLSKATKLMEYLYWGQFESQNGELGIPINFNPVVIGAAFFIAFVLQCNIEVEYSATWNESFSLTFSNLQEQ